MPGLEDYDCEGVLTIGGISMNRPAWAVLGDDRGAGGLFQLLTTAEIRGDDRLLPGTAGVIPFRRRITVSRHVLRLVVTGDVNSSGVATSDSKEGLAANLAYLWTNVITPPGTGNSLRAATWTPPGQAQRTADIHVIRCDQTEYHLGEDSAVWVGNLTISIPAGRFA